MPSRKGSPNRLQASAKENVVAVFTRLGGTAEMAKWAKDHPTEFYKIYARLVPQELKADVAGDVLLRVVTGVPQANAS